MVFTEEQLNSLLSQGLKVTDEQYRINCPICGERDKKCYVYYSSSTMYCFKCLQRTFLPNLPKREEIIHNYHFKEVIKLPYLLPLLKNGPQNLYRYAKSRIRDEKLFSKLQLSYAPNVPRYNNRIIFPVTRYNKKVYLQARSTYESKVKYLNPCPGGAGRDHRFCLEDCKGETTFGKSDVVYNLDNLVMRGCTEVVICEGIISSLALPNAVAIFGKSISTEQIHLIKQANFSKITVMLDKGVELCAFKLAEKLLIAGIEEVYVALIESKDPDVATTVELMNSLDKSEKFTYSTILGKIMMYSLDANCRWTYNKEDDLQDVSCSEDLPVVEEILYHQEIKDKNRGAYVCN